MIYKTYSSDASKLLSLPETGMGYQIFDSQLTGDYVTRRYVAYNSELILELDNEFLKYKQQIIDRGFSQILNESKLLNIRTDSIKLVSRSLILESKRLSDFTRITFQRESGGKGAIDSPKVNADGKEIFTRISAFENDKRIDFEKKKLKDGTFTTTLYDYIACVKSNDDPIDRYALPNNDKIKWAFYIQPKPIDQLQRGIVQPAFGHEGGGIEAYFEKGTSENTYFSKKNYGDLY